MLSATRPEKREIFKKILLLNITSSGLQCKTFNSTAGIPVPIKLRLLVCHSVVWNPVLIKGTKPVYMEFQCTLVYIEIPAVVNGFQC